MGEEGSGRAGSVGVLRLHEDEGHAVLGPVGFEKGGEGGVVAFEEGVGEEGGFEVFKGGSEGGCPFFCGNGFTVEPADQEAEWARSDFKVWDEAGVEVEETNKGVEGGAMGGEGPVSDRVKLGGGGAVTLRAEIKSDPFHSLQEEVTLLWVEGEPPFGEDVADTFKVEQEGAGVVAEEEDVINDLPVPALDEGSGHRVQAEFREPFPEESLPFLLHKEHEDAVASRSIEGPKGHDIEGVEDVSGGTKAELLSVTVPDGDLVET